MCSCLLVCKPIPNTRLHAKQLFIYGRGLQKVLPKRSDPDRENVLDVLDNNQPPQCHVTLHRWHHSKKNKPHFASSKFRGRHSLGSRSMFANTSEHSALLQSSRPNIFPAPQIPLVVRPHSHVHHRFQVVSEKMQNFPPKKKVIASLV